MSENFKVLLFYKYVKIENPEIFVQIHQNFCNKHEIKGRILIGDEGINATIAGKPDKIQLYINEMKKDLRFADVDFKESDSDFMPFPKLKVKYRKEIVTLGLSRDIDMETAKRGEYLEPDELHEIIKNHKDEYVFLDARNNYESKIGKFENAITPDIENFRDLPKVLKELEHLKKKKVIFYCTGGIRCEKATAYAIQEGFESVYHIKGGIQRYAEKYPKDGFVGSMYIFDDRIAVQFDKSEDRKVLTKCVFCEQDYDSYKNCYNAKCNKKFIVCDECYKSHNGYCCKECEIFADTKRKRFLFENKL